MFRSALWRTEKNKIKAVFKLLFHVTQVSVANVDTLVISVVPGDVGKVTTRLEKGVVRDGSCKWEHPIYVTVKFVSDAKTGKINERIYNFVVSNGLVKNSLVGEVSIDFAGYAEATKASTVSLPLKNSKSSNGVLHVSIQRLQTNVDQREVEETEDRKLKFQFITLNNLLKSADTDEEIKTRSNDDQLLDNAARDAELNGDLGTSSVSDITMSSSESSPGLNTPRELALRSNGSNGVLHDTNGFLSSQSQITAPYRSTINASGTISGERQRSQREWQADSGQVLSNDGTNGSQAALSRERSQQSSDIVTENLKAEVVALSRQVDLSELELQTLRKHIVKESKRGQDLLREFAEVKEERDALRSECENLKALQKRLGETKTIKNKMQFVTGDPRALLEEIRQELNYEKDLNANLRLQLQKTQESNAELILAVKDLEEMLNQRSRETSDSSHKLTICEKTTVRSESDDDDEEQKALEELVKEHTEAKDAYVLEQKIMDLCSEIEMYRRDKDEVEMQMEQLALDYEILKQENHELSYKLEQSQLQEQLKMQYECSSSFANVNELESHIQNLETELQKQSKEYSDSLSTISELEAHIQSLENELKVQSKRYSDSIVTINSLESRTLNLENELKQQSKGYSDSLNTINELKTSIWSLENELKNRSEEFSDSLATRRELENQTQRLENELKNKSRQHSNSLATIDELENHVKALEEELEKQAQGFEADLEALTKEKVDQEQRAIRAEEALRKTRCKNASAAEKIQEEFRRLSLQMASTFEANEKVATKALAEASELRMQKHQLEDMLQKANEELRSARVSYQVRLEKLSCQLKSKVDQMEKMAAETDGKSKQLEHQREHEEELKGNFSEEVSRLKAELERLVKINKVLSEQVRHNENAGIELENLKASVKQTEELLERGSLERNELMSAIASMKKEAEKSVQELNRLRSLNDDKDTALSILQSEIEKLKAQLKDLKHCLSEDEPEKEKLRKLVFQLKGDLKKKEDGFIGLEKKLKECNKNAAASNGVKSSLKTYRSASLHGSKEMAKLKERVKLLERQIKLKEAALETSANLFSEKERDLRNKIEELENRVCELNENGRSICDNSSQKLAEDTASMDELLGEVKSLKERNKAMESELKEMQERYSAISLKFAEVEGERQELVMKVRNLKNAIKN